LPARLSVKLGLPEVAVGTLLRWRIKGLYGVDVCIFSGRICIFLFVGDGDDFGTCSGVVGGIGRIEVLLLLLAAGWLGGGILCPDGVSDKSVCLNLLAWLRFLRPCERVEGFSIPDGVACPHRWCCRRLWTTFPAACSSAGGGGSVFSLVLLANRRPMLFQQIRGALVESERQLLR
jgi:hypothetical protein